MGAEDRFEGCADRPVGCVVGRGLNTAVRPTTGTGAIDAVRARRLAFVFAGAGSGAARTTVRVPAALPPRSVSCEGGESALTVTNAGSVTAVAKAAPTSAAEATMTRFLLTPFPRFADSFDHGIGGIARNLNCES